MDVAGIGQQRAQALQRVRRCRTRARPPLSARPDDTARSTPATACAVRARVALVLRPSPACVHSASGSVSPTSPQLRDGAIPTLAGAALGRAFLVICAPAQAAIELGVEEVRAAGRTAGAT
eukprot:673870-Prymnesium_polylepis.1